MKNSRLYFAYADNMNEDIVRDICPGVAFEGVAEFRGHRPIFNSQGKITITEDESASIWGVVWCLSMRDIYLLDNKELETLGKFKKLTRDIHFLDDRAAKAFLYITDVGDRSEYSQNLLDFIIEQAHYWSLPTQYIEFLKNIREEHG